MKYKSTRGKVNDITFTDTVLMGLADDGGLMIPDTIPLLTQTQLLDLKDLSYEELAFNIMKLFIDDISDNVLKNIIKKSYSTFDTKEIIPVRQFDNIYVAEIFHGPTYAFKDIALQFLGNLFEYVLSLKSQKMNILGATSGDTGSAAIHGFRGKKDINIFILHPHGKVSPVQELQMTTVLDKNVYNIAIDGTFDDCQYIVKSIFNDLDFKREYFLGAINSINWARVLAQIVYYFYAYFKVEKNNLEEVYFSVPTGNFGNIFAGFIAKKMGLPIKKLILATNENNILTRFVNNGDYSIAEVVETYSPSMDIQIASNLERYFYFLFDEDTGKVNDTIKKFGETGKIVFDRALLRKIQNDFLSFSTTNEETLRVIKKFYEKYGYILDPHTSCGINAVLNLMSKDDIYITLATAHPAKFPEAIFKAISRLPDEPVRIKELKNKEKRFVKLPNSIEEVKNFITNQLDASRGI
jgi:threonine synthase